MHPTLNEPLALLGGPKAKTTPNIPMFPGGNEIGDAEKAQILEVLDRKQLFRYYGPGNFPSKVKELEGKFAEMVGSEHALGVSSGTAALICALIACDIGPGDEVLVPGYTFFASCSAVVNVGAVPVICDTDATLTLDLADAERRLTPLTRAVMTVHMSGAPCEMDALVEFCQRNNLKLIEDTAQACGGTYKGKHLGTFGDVGCFSFQYHKIMTAGEGGMLVTNSALLYDRAMCYHDCGASWRPNLYGAPRYEGELFCGDNYRMSELAGAILLAQFERLPGLLERMRRHQATIIAGIKDLPGVQPRPSHDAAGDVGTSVIFYADSPEKAASFGRALKAEGIDAKTVFAKGFPDWHFYHHWTHILSKNSTTHSFNPWQHPAYVERGGNVHYAVDQCPVMLERLNRAIQIYVPPQLTDEDVQMIIHGVRKVAMAVEMGALG